MKALTLNLEDGLSQIDAVFPAVIKLVWHQNLQRNWSHHCVPECLLKVVSLVSTSTHTHSASGPTVQKDDQKDDVHFHRPLGLIADVQSALQGERQRLEQNCRLDDFIFVVYDYLSFCQRAHPSRSSSLLQWLPWELSVSWVWMPHLYLSAILTPFCHPHPSQHWHCQPAEVASPQNSCMPNFVSPWETLAHIRIGTTSCEIFSHVISIVYLIINLHCIPYILQLIGDSQKSIEVKDERFQSTDFT